MSDLLTSISIPGTLGGWGLMEYGRLTPVQMISSLRARAAYLRQQVEAIEQAVDADFDIRIVRGVHVQHPVAVLQEGKKVDD